MAGVPLKSLANYGAVAEAVAGTFEEPDATEAKSKIIKSPDITFDGARVERNIASATGGTFPSDVGPRSGVFSSVVEFEGSGTVDVSPAWDVLLRSCGFTQILDTVVTNKYATTLTQSATAATGYPTASLAYHEGPTGVTGHAYKIAGAVGNLVMNFVNGETVKFNFTHTGKYVTKTDVALLTPVVYDTVNAPVVISATLLFTDVTGGTPPTTWAPNVSELTIDTGNTIELDEDANDATGFSCGVITDRNPTGTMVVAADLEATYRIFGNAVENIHTATLAVTVGSTLFNNMTVDIPVLQFSLPSLAARGTRAGFTVPFMIRRDTGTDGDINFTLPQV